MFTIADFIAAVSASEEASSEVITTFVDFFSDYVQLDLSFDRRQILVLSTRT